MTARPFPLDAAPWMLEMLAAVAAEAVRAPGKTSLDAAATPLSSVSQQQAELYKAHITDIDDVSTTTKTKTNTTTLLRVNSRLGPPAHVRHENSSDEQAAMRRLGALLEKVNQVMNKQQQHHTTLLLQQQQRHQPPKCPSPQQPHLSDSAAAHVCHIAPARIHIRCHRNTKAT
jgi:hypothetical protein